MADRVTDLVISELELDCRRYSFLDRGSDERQYCSPGVDLPVASLMRSKYGEFDEYHTSLDDLEFVTPNGLQGGLDMMAHAVRIMELNGIWRATLPGEPQMGRRGLYPTTSARGTGQDVRDMMNVLTYLDGTNDVVDLASICGLSVSQVSDHITRLEQAGVIERIPA